VRTELETGHRMVEQAIKQRGQEEHDGTMQSLSLARVALTGAERHLAAVDLPQRDKRSLLADARELRRRIEGLEKSATAR